MSNVRKEPLYEKCFDFNYNEKVQLILSYSGSEIYKDSSVIELMLDSVVEELHDESKLGDSEIMAGVLRLSVAVDEKSFRTFV